MTFQIAYQISTAFLETVFIPNTLGLVLKFDVRKRNLHLFTTHPWLDLIWAPKAHNYILDIAILRLKSRSIALTPSIFNTKTKTMQKNSSSTDCTVQTLLLF